MSSSRGIALSNLEPICRTQLRSLLLCIFLVICRAFVIVVVGIDQIVQKWGLRSIFPGGEEKAFWGWTLIFTFTLMCSLLSGDVYQYTYDD